MKSKRQEIWNEMEETLKAYVSEGNNKLSEVVRNDPSGTGYLTGYVFALAMMIVESKYHLVEKVSN